MFAEQTRQVAAQRGSAASARSAASDHSDLRIGLHDKHPDHAGHGPAGALMLMSEVPIAKHSSATGAGNVAPRHGPLGSASIPFIQAKATSGSIAASAGSTIQRAPTTNDPIHDPLLDAYSEYSGLPRDQVSQHDPDYERWLSSSLSLGDELEKLIAEATWPAIRKRVYPAESAPNIALAKERHAGTKPDLTGIGNLKSVEHFVGNVRTIQGKWATLATADARKDALGKAGSDELVSAGVPAFLSVTKEPMSAKGYFSPADWRFAISQVLVESPTLSDPDAAEVANTTLHESRHAEQHFVMARFSAGVLKHTASVIAKEGPIPQKIAEAAVAKKFDSTTDAAVLAFGTQMYDSMVTHSTENEAATAAMGVEVDPGGPLATVRQKAQTALQDLRSSATDRHTAKAMAARDALKAEIAKVEKLYHAYRSIPHEADAHVVGDTASEAFSGWKS